MVFLLTLLHGNISCAELRDPTKPAFFSANNKTEFKPVEDLKLSSIWISNHSKRVTINGVTARQGEVIFSDIKIVKILTHSVLIKQNDIERKLYLLTRPFKSGKNKSSSLHE
jgi:hypothetical protein